MTDNKIHGNNNSSTLDGAILAGDLVINVADATGWPSPTGSEYFPFTIDDTAGNIEIGHCTSRTGNALTVTRGQEGTTAQGFASGITIAVRLTKDSIDRKQQDLDGLALTQKVTPVAGDKVLIQNNASSDALQYADFSAFGGGGGTPGGSNTQIQYNNAGAFGGDSGFTTDGSGNVTCMGSIDITSAYISVGGSSSSTTYSFTSSGGVPYMKGDANSFIYTGNSEVYAQWGTSWNRLVMDTSSDLRVFTNNSLRFQITDSGVTISNGALTGGSGVTVDFGDADSLEIPNAVSPTLSAAGEIALNTTDDYIEFYDGAATQSLRINRNTAFNVYRNTPQTLTNVTTTKIQLDSELYDYGNLFDSSTNYRYTPDISGVYIFVASTIINSGTDGQYTICQIQKNGSAVAQTGFRQGSAGDCGAVVLCTAYLNGSTDYVEFYVYQDSGSNKDVGGGDEVTFFTGGLLEEQ